MVKSHKASISSASLSTKGTVNPLGWRDEYSCFTLFPIISNVCWEETKVFVRVLNSSNVRKFLSCSRKLERYPYAESNNFIVCGNLELNGFFVNKVKFDPIVLSFISFKSEVAKALCAGISLPSLDTMDLYQSELLASI